MLKLFFLLICDTIAPTETNVKHVSNSCQLIVKAYLHIYIFVNYLLIYCQLQSKAYIHKYKLSDNHPKLSSPCFQKSNPKTAFSPIIC